MERGGQKKGVSEMAKKRRKYSAEFKARVALAAVREQETLAQIAKRYGVHQNMVSKWKKRLLDNITRAFEPELAMGAADTEREAELLKKIGELTMERDFLQSGLDRYR